MLRSQAKLTEKKYVTPIADPLLVATEGALFVLMAAGVGVFIGSFFPNVAAYRAFAILFAVVSTLLSGKFPKVEDEFAERINPLGLGKQSLDVIGNIGYPHTNFCGRSP